MKQEQYQFRFDVYDSADDLPEDDRKLLTEAREITEKAYAPYSHFHVGAVARLQNGALTYGSNQENAAYPVGICAERVLLSAASILHTDIPIESMAISYHNKQGDSSRPVSPCGMCRQSLCEYEERQGRPIRLILSGMEGKVVVIASAGQLLPLSFGSNDLKS